MSHEFSFPSRLRQWRTGSKFSSSANILNRAEGTAELRATAHHARWLCANVVKYVELSEQTPGQWTVLTMWAHAVVLHSRILAIARVVV